MLALGLAPASCSSGELTRYEFSQPQMGVPFKIILYGTNDTKVEAAAKAAFKRIRELNNLLSDYDPDSELSLLSKSSGSGEARRVSPELWLVLTTAQEVSERSDGAFDVTVGPCVQLWRQARRTHRLPDPAKLALALKSVGFRHIVFHPADRSVELRLPGMRLDLGGIAKGYAADEALAVLRRRGFSRALVAASGDMAIGDPPPGQKAWRIEVAPLDVTNAPPKRFVLLANKGIATSGDLFQRLDLGGKRYSHVLDPRTGLGLTDHSLVTVISTNGITADAYTKTVSVLGPDKGLALVRNTPGLAAHVVRVVNAKIELRESENFERFCLKEK